MRTHAVGYSYIAFNAYSMFSNPEIAQIGIGMRSNHFRQIVEEQPPLAWMELLADNHLQENTRSFKEAEAIAELYPVSLHSVGLSIGSADPLNADYLKALKTLARATNPWLMSDHLCWCAVHGLQSHDLLPLPYTEETAQYVAQRIRLVQDYLEVPFAIENVSTYLNFKDSTLREGEFVSMVAQEADCKILFDINNIYVAYRNNGTDFDQYLRDIDASRVAEIHLAGFEDCGDYVIDAHNNPVHPQVWSLYGQFIQQAGSIPTLIEWDNDIPPLSVILDEADHAREIITSKVA